jgi:hypothetical protein
VLLYSVQQKLKQPLYDSIKNLGNLYRGLKVKTLSAMFDPFGGSGSMFFLLQVWSQDLLNDTATIILLILAVPVNVVLSCSNRFVAFWEPNKPNQASWSLSLKSAKPDAQSSRV